MWKHVVILACVCGGILLTLRALGQLTSAEVVRDIAIIVGWIVTVLVATHQQRATRQENDRIKRNDLRRTLQAEAFRNISEAAIKYSGEISDIWSRYSVTSFSLSRPPVLSYEPAIHNIYVHLTQDLVALHQAMARFAFVVETYQLAIPDLHHLYLYIRFRVDDVAQQLSSLPLRLPENDVLHIAATRSEFQRECSEISERLYDVGLYIGDFRIELMNSILSSVFEGSAPRRRPYDPKLKTLVELATPEAVKSENERRVRDAIRAGPEFNGDEEPA